MSVIGVAAVDHQRQTGAAGGLDMGAKNSCGGVARRAVVMIIETRLADADAFWMGCERNQTIEISFRRLTDVLGMFANRAEHLGISLRQRGDLAKFLDPGRNRDHAPDAGRARTLDDGIALRGEIGKVEMAVTVDQHGLT